jgi:hypothetical protein
MSGADYVKAEFSIQDSSTGRPLSLASVRLYAGGEAFTEGVSDSNGDFQTVVPSRLSSSGLTVLVQHPGYQDDRAVVAFPSAGNIQHLQLQPNATTVPPVAQSFKSTFKFSGFPLNLSLTFDPTQFNYGYTSLESDRTVTGEGIRIKSVRVDLKVRVHLEHACCDVWVLLGPGPALFMPGAISASTYSFVAPSHQIAPVQAQFVIGNGGQPLTKEDVVPFYATYDFESGQWGGNVDSTTKEFSAPQLSLPNGLYAQVFLWSGNTAVNLDIESLSLVVEGTKPNH